MLSQGHRATLQRALSPGAGGQAVPLTPDECLALLAIALNDLGHKGLVSTPGAPPPDFLSAGLSVLPDASLADLEAAFESALHLDPDIDTYFACLAKLYKSRKKYQLIIASQPFATMDQVGPRALLQFGFLPNAELGALLIWRKWLFDLDNRAGQETGYVFEPIIASAIGGVPASANTSPVRRHKDKSKGRQVDCIRGEDAYEFKVRVTIAASGQGRWREELDFAEDCRSSGFRPSLVVLDPTPNPRLAELKKTFTNSGGQAFIGAEAWEHLESIAGPSMARFLEGYVREPLDGLLRDLPDTLPPLTLRLAADAVVFKVGDQEFPARRLATSDGIN
jgi:hypothetical protein